MSLTLYDAAIPLYVRMLKSLAAILDKGEAFAREKGMDPASLTAARLAPDMAPLTGQVQMASDAAKGGAARLAATEAPTMEDTETTFAELKDRVARTIAYLESVDREQVNSGEGRPIEMKFPGATMTFSARDFLFQFSLPNFLFHVTTAYDVLRHKGVPLGKMDFLAGGAAPPAGT
ncbi:MAG TPA: DUF1993 domain-containing protein [Caulobacteraceae bacterium]